MNKSEIISISMGNTKMGFVPSFSLPPIKTCNQTMGCSKRGCYACRMFSRRKSVKESYNKNLRIVDGGFACERFKKQLEGWLNIYQPKAFRFHVSGDFHRIEYLDTCVSIAKRFPKVKFYAFTKQWDIIREHMNCAYNRGKFPKNFSIILSAWLPSTHNWCPPEDLMKKFPVAWVWKDNRDLAMIQNAEDMIRGIGKWKASCCDGNCETCGKCFSLRKKDGDVLIKYH